MITAQEAIKTVEGNRSVRLKKLMNEADVEIRKEVSKGSRWCRVKLAAWDMEYSDISAEVIKNLKELGFRAEFHKGDMGPDYIQVSW